MQSTHFQLVRNTPTAIYTPNLLKQIPAIREVPRLLTRWRAPATCGELMQGYLNGQDFLVNCPINLFAYASAYEPEHPGLYMKDAGQYGKISKAITLVAERLGLDLQHRIVIESNIPRGKGMASSTADISAALEALCQSCHVSLTDAEFAKFITEVEPSDCVHYSGISQVNHLTGELYDQYLAPNQLRVMIVDCGGEIDTVKFNRDRARAMYTQHQAELQNALNTMKQGLRNEQLHLIGQAATTSAQLSQKVLNKPQFADLLALSTELGGLGVNCAHSGTVLGVLYKASEKLHDILLQKIDQHFGADLEILGDFQVIGGGCVEY